MLPFIRKKSLQVRSKLVKSAHDNLSFCHLEVVFQSPYKRPTLFHFKETLIKNFVLILFIVSRVAAAMLLIMVKLTETFLQDLQTMWVFQI